MRIDWPPKAEQKKFRRNGNRWMSEGEPSVIPLKRMGNNDRSVRGQEWNKCCGCGLMHLFVYEVVRAPEGEFFMNNRAYVREDTRPKPRRRRRKK